MPKTPLERWHAWKERHGADHRNAQDRERHRLFRAAHTKRFVGVDGEGCGEDEFGRQVYRLLRAGEHQLFRDGAELTTVECFEFLLSLPRHAIYVGYGFDYDVTQILKHIDADKLRKIFDETSEQNYTFWKDYAIDYRPRQYLRIARVNGTRIQRHTARTIYEVVGFFQCSFLRALKNFGVGLQHLEQIERNKAARGTITHIDAETIEYNTLECALLAEMMERFRETCHEADIRPHTWNGAGKLASALHKTHKTIRAQDIILPDGLKADATASYYGGRFEITHIGLIDKPVTVYDIRSAYPAAMQNLPCLKHGIWRRTRNPNPASIYFADVRFSHPKESILCGLPIRTKTGRIFWPRRGMGTYAGCEIEAAKLLGAQITLTGDAWEYVADCTCNTFGWVRDLYDYRRSIGSDTRGYPIKLGINSLYGKLAQRAGGGGPYTNHLWASLVTAQTRAWLMQAAASDPGAVMMLATDGIAAHRPLAYAEERLGTGLGAWERTDRDFMHIVQPGLYWSKSVPKTRGIPRAVFEAHLHRFEDAWNGFIRRRKFDPSRAPIVEVPLNIFVGLRLALHRNKPLLAGRWMMQRRKVSYDWHAKRGAGTRVDTHVYTLPRDGDDALRSMIYAPLPERDSVLEAQAREFEALPDYAELLPMDNVTQGE